MALNGSGPISIGGPTAGQSINLEFGRAANATTSMSQLYRGGGIVPNVTANNAIPTSGTISLSQFYGATNSAPFSPILRDYTTPVANATETAPIGCSQVRICVWGGGSGGSAGDGSAGGDGGDSGSYCESVYSITGGQTLVYTVGAGGTGGTYPLGIGSAGGASSVSSGTATITTMSAAGDPSGGNVSNVYPNYGGPGGIGGGAGGAAIVGWSGYSAGAGGAGGSRYSGGRSGAAGRVIFYYT